MHPAFSVIFFTAASGAGYGLVALVGLLSAFGRVPQAGWFGFAALAFALALITAGLLSSSFHLGRPERAWRAFSQWRSSWLSREGVIAVLSYAPTGVFGLGWVVFGRTDGWFALAGLMATAMAMLTVWCTAMIYASLKPIHQWHNKWVPANYLSLALLTGALWLNALVHLWGRPDPVVGAIAVAATLLAAWLKESYWRFIDTVPAASTPESATGLGARGTVRVLDAPHTEENYLLKEMGYKVARKHAVKLRRLARLFAFALPLALTLAAFVAPAPLALLAALVAAGSAMLGVLVERWLFFAEARHTVTLYYGARQV
ncbi:MAG: dimethyl sulfoxide reductase anchor subunit [Rhodospirillales bacterium]|nr:dimethyl sulfoxide reductase anchor subunit [Rhodospirillales bacterium]